MTTLIFKILFISILILFSGCAPTTKRADLDQVAVKNEAHKQKEVALESLVSKQARLLRTGHPILAAATDLCEDKVRASSGVWFANKYVFPKDFQEAASSSFNLGDQLKTLYVIPGSPADRAGIMADDILMTMNGESVPTGKKAIEKFQKEHKEQLKVGETVTYTIARNNIQSTIEVLPIEVCDYPIVLNESNAVNAFADGKTIAITKGMIRFAETDQELALVISHELAHNTMGHINKKMGNFALGSIVDVLAAAYGIDTQGTFGNMAAGAYSKEFEAEADYVGLYIMAMAGMDIDNAASFWRRMAAEHPESIKSNYGASHPSTPERFVGLEQTEEEIDAKRVANLPLLPEMKE
jgi:hypothetical protein